MRVLVVDDHPLNLKLTRVLLTAEGYDVETADGADEAAERLAASRPDLILMDLQMPGVDGFELTRRIKADATTASIPIVALTSAVMSEDEERARAAGCDGFITKPIDTRCFAEQIAPFVELDAAAERIS